MTVQPQTTDLELVRAMAQGDMHGLDQLYALHGPSILSFLTARLGNRELAEEVLQDVMLAAWKNAATFRGESSVRTWLLVIARNRAINAQRRYTPTMVSLADSPDIHSTDTGPYEAVARDFERSAVRQALEHLPDLHREILVLFFYHQLSGNEIAEVLDISVGTVKSRLHRAKEALKRIMMTQQEGTDAQS